MRRHASDYAAAAVFLVLFAIGGPVPTPVPPPASAPPRPFARTDGARPRPPPRPPPLPSLPLAAVGPLSAVVAAPAPGLVLAVRQRGVRAGPDGMPSAPDAPARQAPAFPPSVRPVD